MLENRVETFYTIKSTKIQSMSRNILYVEYLTVLATTVFQLVSLPDAQGNRSG